MKFNLKRILCFSLLVFGFFFISSCNNEVIHDSASITGPYLPSEDNSSSENEVEDSSSCCLPHRMMWLASPVDDVATSSTIAFIC